MENCKIFKLRSFEYICSKNYKFVCFRLFVTMEGPNFVFINIHYFYFYRENGEKLFGMTSPGSLAGALSPGGSHHGSSHTSPQTSPNNPMTGSRYETYLKIRSNRHARLNGQYQYFLVLWFWSFFVLFFFMLLVFFFFGIVELFFTLKLTQGRAKIHSSMLLAPFPIFPLIPAHFNFLSLHPF